MGFPLVLFLLFGAYRFKASSQILGVDSNYSLVKEGMKNLSGPGLFGISMIISHYPDKIGYFDGKTILDMLLLPVPRSIYTSKPSWYGIDEITRAMGLPSTTQNAVTMPGELIANFGPLGLPFMMIIGLFYGYVVKISKKSIIVYYIYTFWIFQSISTMNWMGFTGLINSIVILPPIGIILFLLLKYCLYEDTTKSLSQPY